MRPLLLLAVLVAAGCGGDGGGSSTEQDAKLEAMTLRLADFPEGFVYGDDSGCGGTATTEGSEPGVDDFLIETRPELCSVDFSRSWGGRPQGVRTVLFRFKSEEQAQRAWELRKPLLGAYNGIVLTTERPGEGEAVAFDSSGLNNPGAGEAWRDDRLLVAVYEEGVGGGPDREFAAELADKQRSRIESPSIPIKPEDDREVGLDDPAIAVPVYWLGREFAPADFPKLEFYRGDNLGGGHGPGAEVKIDYTGKRSSTTLDLWDPARWAQFKQTRLGRISWDRPCVRRSRLELPGGRAEIYGGYSKGCSGEPDHWLAHVYYPDVVVAVNMAYCYMCGGRPPTDPYNSREGVEALVKGLRHRQ